MHDSRGAELKVGDRVLVEMEVIELQGSEDTGYCNVRCKTITPPQKNPPPMVGPSDHFNTRMLTKVGGNALVVAVLLLAILCGTSYAGIFPPMHPVETRADYTRVHTCPCGPACLCVDCDCEHPSSATHAVVAGQGRPSDFYVDCPGGVCSAFNRPRRVAAPKPTVTYLPRGGVAGGNCGACAQSRASVTPFPASQANSRATSRPVRVFFQRVIRGR